MLSEYYILRFIKIGHTWYFKNRRIHQNLFLRINKFTTFGVTYKALFALDLSKFPNYKYKASVQLIFAAAVLLCTVLFLVQSTRSFVFDFFFDRSVDRCRRIYFY